MLTTLEIQDGDPYWWNSPDIWVVPGNDPYGPPAQPTAGEPAFVWARVHNKGDLNVSSACVKFYWSNPALGVLRSISHLIGLAYVDLMEGETKEVLCVVPWIPEIVNNGHECLIAEIIHPLDPLPSPLPDAFEPHLYHQIAQKNITVIEVEDSTIVLPIMIATPTRKEKKLILTTVIGGEVDDVSKKQLGLNRYNVAKDANILVGLSSKQSCEITGDRRIKIDLNKGQRKAVYLKIKATKLEVGSYVLLNVISNDGKQNDGGLSYVLIRRGDVKTK